MTRIQGFSSPLLLGFDEIERVLDRVSKSKNEGYPPYNIERLRGEDSQVDCLRITIAVAGFSEDDIEISIEENQLIVHGKQEDDPSREYIHRGIAARQFQRAFVLAEGIEVTGAELENGLLSILLERPEPQRIIRKVEITNKANNRATVQS